MMERRISYTACGVLLAGLNALTGCSHSNDAGSGAVALNQEKGPVQAPETADQAREQARKRAEAMAERFNQRPGGQ